MSQSLSVIHITRNVSGIGKGRDSTQQAGMLPHHPFAGIFNANSRRIFGRAQIKTVEELWRNFVKWSEAHPLVLACRKCGSSYIDAGLPSAQLLCRLCGNTTHFDGELLVARCTALNIFERRRRTEVRRELERIAGRKQDGALNDILQFAVVAMGPTGWGLCRHENWCVSQRFAEDADKLSTSNARTAAAPRVSTPSLSNISWTCFFTVDSVTPRIVAMSGLVLP